MLDHIQVGVTLDLYSHVTPAMHESASGALGKLLDEPGRDGLGFGGSGVERSLP